MRICVVGGTGNISSAVVSRLLELGHAVTVFNRGQTRSAPPGVRLMRGDRADRAAFEAAIQKEHFDAGIDMICFTPEDAASNVNFLEFEWMTESAQPNRGGMSNFPRLDYSWWINSGTFCKGRTEIFFSTW